jgi:HrpA-like RNA helicase
MKEQSGYSPELNKPIGNRDLPIWQVMPEILETLKTGNRLALVSETGSGKSTQVPQALWEAGLADQATIYIVENRVAVAVEVAKRVASEMKVPVGGLVGYITGPEQQKSNDSKVMFVTSGVFKNIIRNNPQLDGVSVVVFDEFDERYLLSDISLSLTEKAQDAGSQAKFVLMSATLNADKITSHFPQIPLIEAQGRPYPVEAHFYHRDPASREMPQEAAKVAAQIHQAGEEGDILIFMPGKGEIIETIAALEKEGIIGASIFPLHAELSPEDRSRVFASVNGRKIIVSTNVAERGLTIDGIKHVIDSGLVRLSGYEPVSDSTRLGIAACAQDSVIQRRGRAGRTQPGKCYHLYTQENFKGRPASTPPEIQRTALRSVVLQIKAMGYSREQDPIRLMDLPVKENWKTAKNQLRLLGLLDPKDETKLSALGLAVAELSCDPREGVMFLKGCELGCGEELAIIAAIRSSSKRLLYYPEDREDVASTKHRQFKKSDQSDLINALWVYRQAQAHQFDRKWCRENFVSWRALQEVRQNTANLIKQARSQGYSPQKGGINEKLIIQAIHAGYPDKVYENLGRGWYAHADTNQEMRLARESEVAGADHILAHDIIKIPTRKGGNVLLITSATALEK